MTEADPEDADDALRWWVVAAYVLLVVAGFAVAAWSTVSWYVDCDAGRHVSPFTADDSLRGSLCNAGGNVLSGLAMPVAWVLGLAVATVALARARPLLLAALLLAPLVLPAATYGALSRTSTTCPGDKLTAYRQWADAGSKGTPPYECRTF